MQTVWFHKAGFHHLHRLVFPSNKDGLSYRIDCVHDYLYQLVKPFSVNQVIINQMAGLDIFQDDIRIKLLSQFSLAFQYTWSVRGSRIRSPLYPIEDSWEKISKMIKWWVPMSKSFRAIMSWLDSFYAPDFCLAFARIFLMVQAFLGRQ